MQPDEYSAIRRDRTAGEIVWGGGAQELVWEICLF